MKDKPQEQQKKDKEGKAIPLFEPKKDKPLFERQKDKNGKVLPLRKMKQGYSNKALRPPMNKGFQRGNA